MSTRTVSPFIAFCHAKREEVKATNPTANMGRMLAALWKNMSESERMAYTDLRKSIRIANQPENQQEVRPFIPLEEQEPWSLLLGSQAVKHDE